MQPTPAGFELLRGALTRQWERLEVERGSDGVAARQALEVARELRSRLIDAYIYQGALPEADYRERLAALDREILEAEERLSGAEAPALGDLGGLLDYAERLVTGAADSWCRFEPDLRRRFQHLLYPAGVTFDSESGFGTPETCLLFRELRDGNGAGGTLVEPKGVEPSTS